MKSVPNNFQIVNLESFTLATINEMVDPSAISIPTVGDKLDRFRDCFRSTCDSLGLPHSTSALSQLDSEGNCCVV